MLWQIHEGMHCSIVGTCLDRKDIPTLMRKAKLRAVDGSTDYEQHAWFVCQVVSESPLSRYTHRLLDRKFAGALRRYGKLHDEDAVLACWEDARRGGDLAGAYWAIASHARTDEDLRRRVFGDVHMMSHFMIGRNRQDARTLTVAEERVQQLEERLVRVRERQTAAFAQRQGRIGEL